jgi:hypothetical protein
MSLPTTVATTPATTCEMMNRAVSSTQMATSTSENTNQAINDAQRPFTAQQMVLHDYEGMCLSDPSFSVFVTQHHPHGIGPGKPTVTIPSRTPALASPILNLDWE